MSAPEYGCQLLKAVVSYNASHMWLNIFDMIFSVVIFEVLYYLWFEKYLILNTTTQIYRERVATEWEWG